MRSALLSSGTTTGIEGRIPHEDSGERCAVGATRTASAATAATPLPLPWAEAFGLPQGADRHPVRAEDGHRLGRPACRIGLRLWQDLPELPPPLAPGRRLAEAARGAAGRTQRRGRDRLGAGADRRLLRQGTLGGR